MHFPLKVNTLHEWSGCKQEWMWRTTGKRKPSPCATNCDLAASARSTLADTSSSLLGKWLKAPWHRVLGRNTGRSANCLSLSGGKVPPPPGLRCYQRWKGAWQWDCLRKEGFGDTSGAVLQHCTPRQHLCTLSWKPVRYGSNSRSHSASIPLETAVKGTKSNNYNTGVCCLQLAHFSFSSTNNICISAPHVPTEEHQEHKRPMGEHHGEEQAQGGQMVVSAHTEPPVPAPLQVLHSVPWEQGTGNYRALIARRFSLPLTTVFLNCKCNPALQCTSCTTATAK